MALLKKKKEKGVSGLGEGGRSGETIHVNMNNCVKYYVLKQKGSSKTHMKHML